MFIYVYSASPEGVLFLTRIRIVVGVEKVVLTFGAGIRRFWCHSNTAYLINPHIRKHCLAITNYSKYELQMTAAGDNLLYK